LAADVLLFVATIAQTLASVGFIAGISLFCFILPNFFETNTISKGVYPRECAAILFMFLVTVTPVVHNFWVLYSLPSALCSLLSAPSSQYSFLISQLSALSSQLSALRSQLSALRSQLSVLSSPFSSFSRIQSCQ
jgi:hypothetical protein